MTEMRFVEPHGDSCGECERLTKMTPPLNESENDWNHRVHPENTTPAEPNDWPPKPGETKSQREETAELNQEDN